MTNADGSRCTDRYSELCDYGAFNLTDYLGTGVAFNSSDRWLWQLRPTLQCGVLRIIDAPVSAQAYSLSLTAGVRMAL